MVIALCMLFMYIFSHPSKIEQNWRTVTNPLSAEKELMSSGGRIETLTTSFTLDPNII